MRVHFRLREIRGQAACPGVSDSDPSPCAPAILDGYVQAALYRGTQMSPTDPPTLNCRLGPARPMGGVMKVAVIHAPKDLRVDELDRPKAGPDDVVVKVAAAGICGSDLHYRH